MPVNESHPAMNTPQENTNLWRYMDIPSFLSLISSKTLTFVRADLFEDKYEGTLPKVTASLLDAGTHRQIEEGKLNPEYENFSQLLNRDNQSTYMSCWCKENHEMVHMWKIYSKENGVAIEIDYECLKKSITSSEQVYPTEINYLDYERDYLDWKSNALTPYTIKRKEYKSENEFRLLIAHPRLIEDQLVHLKTHEQIQPLRERLYNQTQVIPCEVDTTKLISKIHISPYAPKWYFKVIVDLIEKYGLSEVEVTQSDL